MKQIFKKDEKMDNLKENIILEHLATKIIFKKSKWHALMKPQSLGVNFTF